mmetsp:Transcript_18953/g.53102  ORF Transcript_18953/g.53102 Transcript_18953/m.53102 type:complete len:248 (+) Transcript_18953:372-1115(+)
MGLLSITSVLPLFCCILHVCAVACTSENGPCGPPGNGADVGSCTSDCGGGGCGDRGALPAVFAAKRLLPGLAAAPAAPAPTWGLGSPTSLAKRLLMASLYSCCMPAWSQPLCSTPSAASAAPSCSHVMLQEHSQPCMGCCCCCCCCACCGGALRSAACRAMLCDTIPWVSRRCNEAGRVGERSRLGVGSGGEGMLAPVLAWPWREDVRGRGRGCKGPGEPNGIVLEVPTAEVEAGWFAGVGIEEPAP